MGIYHFQSQNELKRTKGPILYKNDWFYTKMDKSVIICKVWNEITYPILDFSSRTFEVLGYASNS